MTSEWLRVMIEEITRKRAEAELACIEESLRCDERRGQAVRTGSGVLKCIDDAE